MKVLGIGETHLAVCLGLDEADTFRKDGEAVPLPPRSSIIKREDPKTVRGQDADLGGVKQVQETLFIRVDVKAAIIGANVQRRHAPGKDATGRGAQFNGQMLHSFEW